MRVEVEECLSEKSTASEEVGVHLRLRVVDRLNDYNMIFMDRRSREHVQERARQVGGCSREVTSNRVRFRTLGCRCDTELGRLQEF